ncbi:SurA N-terminal domain-containing protein [Synergistaceae bacterium OttesenSCG-928-D05]|nr:SurA N-terminal domain-containing protein [Synergistaceae bacterium OttesenSCG-928-D05]
MLTWLRKHTKLIMGIVIAFFVLSIFAGYGMYSRSGSGGGGSDYAAAKIDGKKIMRSTLDTSMMRVLEQMPNNQDITSEDVLYVRKSVLDSMAVQSELEKEAKSRKIEVANDEVNAMYQQIMSQYPTREAFFEFLQRAGVTEQQVKDDIRNQLTQQKVVAELIGTVSVDEKEAQDYYDLTKGFLYRQPAGMKLNIATFTNKGDAEDARKKIAGGAEWDATLNAVGATLRGFTPYATPELMPENIMTGPFEVLKGLGVNKVSPVIEITSDDFSIAINRGKESERVLPYEEVSADLQANLRNQKIQMRQNEVFQELVSRANVEILDAEIFPAPRQPQQQDLPDVGGQSQDVPASDDAN